MKLSPLDSSTIDLAAKWLADETNYQWLDFGGGSQVVTPVSLAFMQQRDVDLRQCHFIGGRAFDRLLFDLIAPEHARSSMGRRPAAAGSSNANSVNAR